MWVGNGVGVSVGKGVAASVSVGVEVSVGGIGVLVGGRGVAVGMTVAFGAAGVAARVGGGGTAVAVGDTSVAADPHVPIRVISVKRMTVLKIGLDIGPLLLLVIGVCPIDISVDHNQRRPTRYHPAKRPL